jgi:hypothetical protein
MGIGEKHPPLGKPIHVWGFDIGVSSHAPDPIIQIVYRDEKNVRLPRGRLSVKPAGRNQRRQGHRCGAPGHQLEELPPAFFGFSCILHTMLLWTILACHSVAFRPHDVNGIASAATLSLEALADFINPFTPANRHDRMGHNKA